jgi:hypothetical protein
MRYSGLPVTVASALPADGVTGVDLHATGLEQAGAGAHQVVAFDLLGVAAGGRKHQHRYTEVAPSCHRELLVHPL